MENNQYSADIVINVGKKTKQKKNKKYMFIHIINAICCWAVCTFLLVMNFHSIVAFIEGPTVKGAVMNIILLGFSVVNIYLYIIMTTAIHKILIEKGDKNE